MLDRLHEAVAAAAPIEGVSVGTPGDPSTVRIDFAADATPEQRSAALAAVSAFDWSPAAESAWEEDRLPERKAVRTQLAAAIAANQAYLGIATPTAAQVREQTERLTRQMTAALRRLAQL